MIVTEFVSDDRKLTGRLYCDVKEHYYLASVDLLGQEITDIKELYDRKNIPEVTQRDAHYRATSFLRGAIQTYEALVNKGLISDIDWGDDLR